MVGDHREGSGRHINILRSHIDGVVGHSKMMQWNMTRVGRHIDMFGCYMNVFSCHSNILGGHMDGV